MSQLVVHLSGDRVGLLIRKASGNLQFRYDSDYAGLPLSQALPVQSEAHPHAVCRAVFGGLLLEGAPRLTLARNLGVSAENDYALLHELGGDCAGAITLLDPDADVAAEPAARRLDADALDGLLAELPQRPLAADPDQGVRLSLAGAQPKLPLIVGDDGAFSRPLNAAAPTTHILKPEPEGFPGLVDNEAFCMELARAVELRVASVSKQRTGSGRPYLLVERYDRDRTVEPIRRLHQEDVCQALGHPSDRKYQAEGGPGVAAMVELLRRCSAVPAQDLPVLWRALVFNWLIGNCDAHAKNFSLLYGSRAPVLAPLYDLVSTVVYSQLTTRLAMTLDGARRLEQVTVDSWLGLAREIGFSQGFAERELRELAARTVTAADRLAEHPGHTSDTVAELREGIWARYALVAA